ncbi:MAG: hypothetical protein ACOY3J_06495 [Bacillota bacterium]
MGATNNKKQKRGQSLSLAATTDVYFFAPFFHDILAGSFIKFGRARAVVREKLFALLALAADHTVSPFFFNVARYFYIVSSIFAFMKKNSLKDVL